MNVNQITELKKYKRFFSFGCSFTKYYWSTWADIVGIHIGESYNYGWPAAGNTYIASSIIEANKRHKFNSNDLVMVMWTNIAREDRYVRDGWVCAGNIYNQSHYDKNFIMNLTCPRGYFLRDMLHIESSKILLESTGCHWDFMSMVPIAQISQYDNSLEESHDIFEMFSDNIKIIKPSVYEVIYNFDYHSRNGGIKIKHTDLMIRDDYHPNPAMHLEYLEKIYPYIDINSNVKEIISNTTLELTNLSYLDSRNGKKYGISIPSGERF
jgi:hypothetical protein